MKRILLLPVLTSYLTTNQQLTPKQCGYKKNSTESSIRHTSDAILDYFDRKLLAAVVC